MPWFPPACASKETAETGFGSEKRNGHRKRSGGFNGSLTGGRIFPGPIERRGDVALMLDGQQSGRQFHISEFPKIAGNADRRAPSVEGGAGGA